jgi:sugar phosphate isomerase/epimerase
MEVAVEPRRRLLARDLSQRSLEGQPMKLVYHTIVAGTDEPLEDLVPVMAAAGMQAVEAHSATIRWFKPETEEQLAAIHSALQTTGVELYSVHCPCGQGLDWSSVDEEVCELAQGMVGSVIEGSAELGASVVVLHPGRVSDNETDAAYVERLANNIAPLRVTAEAEEITLALENMPYQREHTEVMANVVRLTGSRRLVVCLDTGHAHMIEGLAEAIRAAGDTIGHIHMHDNDGLHDQHLLPGQGSINWKDLAPLIGDGSEYRGALVLEACLPKSLALADLHEKMAALVLAR